MQRKLKNSFVAEWFVLALLLILLGSFTTYNLYQRRTDLMQGEQQRLQTQARVINANLSAQLQRTDYLLQSLRKELSHIPADRWTQLIPQQRTELLVKSIPGIRSVLALDSNGILRLGNWREMLGKNLGHRDYFRIAKQHSNTAVLHVSPPFKTLLGAWAINLVRTITDAQGHFAGIVVATLDEEYFTTLLGSVNYAPDMRTALAHGDGCLFLMVPELDRLRGLNLNRPGSLFSRHLDSGKQDTIYQDKVYTTGELRLVAQHTIQPPDLGMDKPFIVSVSRDIAAVQAIWRRHARQQLLTLSAITAITIAALAAFQLYQRKQIVLIEKTEKELRDTQQQLAQIIDFLPDATFVIDTEKKVLVWNKAMEKMSGVSKEQMIGKGDHEYTIPFYGCRRPNLLDLLDEHDADLEGAYSQVRRTGELLEAETFCPAVSNGKGAHVWVMGVPLYDTDGNRIGAIEAIRDLSERKQVEAYLHMLSHGIENSASAFVITNVDGAIEYVNRKFIQLTGYDKEELIGNNPRLFKAGTTSRQVYADLWETILSGKEWRGELLNRRKDGTIYWSITSISPLSNEAGTITHFIANVEDINDRKNAEATIERLAYFDPLTELPNRRMLQDRLELALKRGRRQHNAIALLYLDLDSFKNVNESMGHQTGDRLLQDIASRLTAALRDDDVVCRLGGDEFAIILHDIQHDKDVVPLAEKLLEIVSEPLYLEAREVIVTASIGITLFSKDGTDCKTLQKNADIALYHAKGEGKNTYRFFSDELNESLRDRFAMEHGLRHALEKEEFELLYQPKVHTQTGRVVGVEALLRWNSNEFGLVSPQRFIPLAEETKQIIAIGEWVLRTACHQQVAWQRQGIDLHMAVNLSAVQFKSPALIERIVAVMDETGISADHLELELTESALVDKPLNVVQILEKIRSLGCGIAIDDFGTGYSSLSYLKAFPVTVLKIDRSFVRDLTHNSGDRAIAQSVVNLASNLEMQTVAEGVETHEQLEILRQLGCTYIQGYVYSRPIPAADIPVFVKSLAPAGAQT